MQISVVNYAMFYFVTFDLPKCKLRSKLKYSLTCHVLQVARISACVRAVGDVAARAGEAAPLVAVVGGREGPATETGAIEEIGGSHRERGNS